MNYPREIRRSLMASQWENVIEEEHGPLNKLLISGTSSSWPMQPANNYDQNPSLYESILKQRCESGFIRASEFAAMCGFEIPVKLEAAKDLLEAVPGPLNKRSRLCNSGTSSSSVQPANFNPLDEPSPSLVKSVQTQPYETGYSEADAAGSGITTALGEATMRPGKIVKPKASNFPATLLKIGQWESWSSGTSSSPMQPQPANYNPPLDESSPFGRLSFTQSPSLYESGYSEAYGAGSDLTAAGAGSGRLTTTLVEATMKPGRIMKPKASNFPATLLKIGQWEHKSRCVIGLVAKFYFATRKLVWEVMEKGLKSKIEIEWSNIIALKTNCPLDGPGTLTLVLAKQPLFFREPKPTARKQTVWEKTTDFTNGQASMNRQHILQCDQGIMNKHIEKLVQFDHRIFHLCHQPEIVMDSPYFEDPRRDDSAKSYDPFGNSNRISTCSSIFGTDQNLASPFKNQSSPDSVIDARVNEGTGSAEAVNCKENELTNIMEERKFKKTKNSK